MENVKQGPIEILYFGRSAVVACDGDCDRAWGICTRPRIELGDGDDDDFVYLSDAECREAPADPGTYEGGHGKPASAAEFPNKWCVRQCERCAVAYSPELLRFDDWSRRVYNMPQCHPEEWKPIPGFPGYEASDRGRVRSFKRRVGAAGGWEVADRPQRVLKPGTSGRYRSVGLAVDGVVHVRRIGQLVLLAFRGEPPDGTEVCHCDDDGYNDWLYNLRYDTHGANMEDAVLNGCFNFDPEQVVEMRERFAAGEDVRDLARRYGVRRGAVYGICKGEFYRPVGGPRTSRSMARPMGEVEEIRRRCAAGETQKSLAAEYGLHYSAVSLYCSGKRRVEKPRR